MSAPTDPTPLSGAAVPDSTLDELLSELIATRVRHDAMIRLGKIAGSGAVAIEHHAARAAIHAYLIHAYLTQAVAAEREACAKLAEGCTMAKTPQDEHPGETVRRRRKMKGHGLNELAKRIEISPAYLSDFELGRRSLSIPLALKLERVRGIGTAYDLLMQQLRFDLAKRHKEIADAVGRR